MSFHEVRLRRKGSSVIQAMLKRLAEEEGREAGLDARLEEAQELPLGLKTVRTAPVETAKPLTKAALY